MTVAYAAPVWTLTCAAGLEARLRVPLTTAYPDIKATFHFRTTRRPIRLSIGTTPGGRELVDNVTYLPGDHCISFTPGAASYSMDFVLDEEGVATVESLTPAASSLEPLELTTPWAAAKLRGLRHAQSLDVQWWCHRSYQTRVLEHRGPDSWSLRKLEPINGPFDPVNSSDTTLAVSQKTGVATLTANRPLFRTLDVGALIRLTHTGQFKTENLSTLNETTDVIEVTGTGSSRNFHYEVSGTFVGTIELQRSVGNTASWTTIASLTAPTAGPIGVNDGLTNQIVYYRLICTAYTSGTAVASLSYSGGTTDGVARIVTLGADNSASVDILTAFASTQPTVDWSWGSWSDRLGWPATVTLTDGRLLFKRDDRYWISKGDDYESFAIGALPDDAISKRSSGTGARARWLVASDTIYVGMSDLAGWIGTNIDGDPIMPENVRCRLPSSKGAANASAIAHEGGAVYIGRAGRRILRMQRDGDKIETLDLTRLHEDIAGAIGSSTFLELAWQEEPEPRLWAVRSDGQLAISLLSTAEKINGWQRLNHGTFRSVSITPNAPEDDIVVVVERGGTARLEKIAPEAWSSISTAWRLAGAIEYAGADSPSVTGLDHLEDFDVYAWNGRQQGPVKVESGACEFEYPVTAGTIIGLKYVGKYRSARLNWGAMAASALTFWKQVKKIGLLIHKTCGAGIGWGRSFDVDENGDWKHIDFIKDRNAGTAWGDPVEEVSEDIALPFAGGSDRDARICLIMDKAGPAEILGMVPQLEANENK